MIKLTKKQQKQYDKLSKRFKLTKREFLDVYTNVRKAKAKVNRLNKEGDSLKLPKMSTTFNWVKTREDFLHTRKKINKILQRKFKRSINQAQRSNLYKNIRQYFGRKDAKAIIEEFDKMSNAEILDFFDNNQDIDTILYDSDTQLLDIIGMTRDKMHNRIKLYMGDLSEEEAEIELLTQNPLDYLL